MRNCHPAIPSGIETMKNIEHTREEISSLAGSRKTVPKDMDTDRDVIFQPMGRRVAANLGQTILDLALSSGVGIEATCGGKGLCGKCRVRPAGPVSSPSSQELALLNRGNDEDRLACQTRFLQGGTVWIPEQSLSRQQVILTTGQPMEIELDPMLHIHELAVPHPSLQHPKAFEEFLLEC